ncbi:hypothetical protein PISMIDRAFT_684991 [Pisolithus microcarpus 441]|uniref:Uncharacterized protein n=1 Tax=Pisolithus microcarpus 441 TaxID=765257 RepID=A0A0C9YLX9_9AGAM|nr:hypothetical protein BKA83DRAFT_684991 [Pisolithus microcarpus]KIK17746.1 hypothetical protein PISMIDRAFT_684991 [Pisolithus microcarpus 441]
MSVTVLLGSHFSATIALAYLHTLLVQVCTHNYFLKKGRLCTNIWHTMPQSCSQRPAARGSEQLFFCAIHIKEDLQTSNSNFHRAARRTELHQA